MQLQLESVAGVVDALVLVVVAGAIFIEEPADFGTA
jgi:hypothetical protein